MQQHARRKDKEWLKCISVPESFMIEFGWEWSLCEHYLILEPNLWSICLFNREIRIRVFYWHETHVFYLFILVLWRYDPTQVMASSFLRFLDHTQWRSTVGRTSLDEWSARRRDLYLTTHNNHNRQTSMPPVGCEPTISAGERPQNYALDCAVTGIGMCVIYRS
jgi:hypothetical protein